MPKKNLPSSKHEMWKGAKRESVVDVVSAPKPVNWIRKGMYAEAVGTPYELSIAIDWDKFEIVDGIIVRKV